jgi:hypothetical protein
MTIRLIHWLRGQIAERIVQDVPAEVAACEFNCRKAQCRHQEWIDCPNRKRGEAPASGL